MQIKIAYPRVCWCNWYSSYHRPRKIIHFARSPSSGDNVTITGYIYTGRDAAHKRLIGLLKESKKLPIEVEGQIIYYVGPAPTPPGYKCGSAGPKTSYRMDPYTPAL